jgi:prepilin-type N-terminal cleavage/methylation domain-containing protein
MPSLFKKNTGTTKTGFTLIEIMITMALFILLAGIGVGAYFSYYSSSLIKNDINNVNTLIRENRFRALKNPTGDDYGIHINSAERKIIGFRDTYNPVSNENIEVELEQLDISDLSLNPEIGVTNEILFEAQTGKTQNYGSFTISENNFSYTININSQGVVE